MTSPQFHIVAIAKDEGRYIREWLAYCLHLSAASITVYDNDSSDDTAAILALASQQYPICRVPWTTQEGQSPQLGAYNDALQRLRKQVDGADAWVAFIDLDEFLVQTGALSLAQIIEQAAADPETGAIGVCQRLFGDSGHKEYSPEPVLKRFPMCSLPDYGEGKWIKSIYRLRCIERITDAHGSSLLAGRYIFPDMTPITFERMHSQTNAVENSLLQINHYITKSLEEFMQKRQRGGGMAHTEKARLSRYEDMGFFHNRQGLINRMTCPQHNRLSDLIDQQLSSIKF